MKYAATVAVLVAALVVAAFAEAGQQAVTPGQFAALTKRVKKLEKDDNAVLSYVGSCFSAWAPVSRYGGLPTEGYVYGYSDGHAGFESALDATAQGDKPSFFVPAAAQDCTLSAYRKLAASDSRLPQPRIVRPAARGASR
jgi:hypothetical protein